MGKGKGEHPPIKFIKDQYFCQLCIFLFMGTAITLSSFSAGMDDGGSSPYPYFFTGFVLGPILLVNFIARTYVIRTVMEKGVSRLNIVDVLNNSKFGKYLWPWSCRIGMLWCIPGAIVTGIAGVGCGIEEKEDGNRTVRNTCYYDIEGEHAELYKGLAGGLVAMHVLSFVYLLLSNCPVHTVMDQIKEDPRRNTRPPAARAVAPAASPSGSQTVTPSANTTGATASGGASNIAEMTITMQQLEARVRELESRELRSRELSVLPPPPAYSDLMDSAGGKGTGAHPVNTIA